MKAIKGSGILGGAVTIVSTTGATTTTIDTIPIITNSGLLIQAKVVGIKDDHAMKGGFKLIGMFANDSGTVTRQGFVGNVFAQTEAGWIVTMVVSGTNVLIRVKGAAATNISWKCQRTSVGV